MFSLSRNTTLEHQDSKGVLVFIKSSLQGEEIVQMLKTYLNHMSYLWNGQQLKEDWHYIVHRHCCIGVIVG
jgi:5S rRNA maturation endonuclease (ribonuclease M5)